MNATPKQIAQVLGRYLREVSIALDCSPQEAAKQLLSTFEWHSLARRLLTRMANATDEECRETMAKVLKRRSELN